MYKIPKRYKQNAINAHLNRAAHIVGKIKQLNKNY